MKELTNKAIEWCKGLEIDGCITGSCLLDYFEGQDIDIFAYSEAAFNKALYSMHFNPLFQLIEPIEQWKFDEWINKKQSSLNKFGLVTIKFKYNLAVDVNVIFKKHKKNAFDIISSFDLDIICKAYDIKTKQSLDLSQNDGMNAHWNRWNSSYYANDIWTINRLLRQFQRCIKYHKRGYNTDEVVRKYIELLDKVIEYKNIFNSISFDAKLKDIKENGAILKEILNQWLENHELTDEELELLIKKTREL